MMWKDVEENLPPVCMSVLICTNRGNICTGYLAKRKTREWFLHDEELRQEAITGWQPLPKGLIYSKELNKHINPTGNETVAYSHHLQYEIREEEGEYLKKLVHEYFDKNTEDIKYEIWNGSSNALKEFLSENIDDIMKSIGKEFKFSFNEIKASFRLD